MKATSRSLLFAPFILLSACASKQELVVVKDNLQDLRSQSETMRTQSAGSYSDLQQIRSQLGRLQGAMEEQSYRNRQTFGRLGLEDSLLVHKADELESRIRNIERYLGIEPPPKKEPVPAPAPAPAAAATTADTLAAPAAAAPAPAAAAPDSASAVPAADAASAAPAPKPALPPLPKPPVPTDSDLFNEGAELFGKERFALSRDKFAELVKIHPDSGLADDAQFFIAESWFNQQSYEQAILEYQKLIAKYTKSEKRPAALFKQARAFELIGDLQSAKTRYRDIVNVYPDSPEAKIAAGRK